MREIRQALTMAAERRMMGTTTTMLAQRTMTREPILMLLLMKLKLRMTMNVWSFVCVAICVVASAGPAQCADDAAPWSPMRCEASAHVSSRSTLTATLTGTHHRCCCHQNLTPTTRTDETTKRTSLDAANYCQTFQLLPFQFVVVPSESCLYLEW